MQSILQPSHVSFSPIGMRSFVFCRTIHVFVATKVLLRQAYFVATKDVFCRDKYVFVATKVQPSHVSISPIGMSFCFCCCFLCGLLLHQTRLCGDKSFVATSPFLSRQKTCFVATKLVAASATDKTVQTLQPSHVSGSPVDRTNLSKSVESPPASRVSMPDARPDGAVTRVEDVVAVGNTALVRAITPRRHHQRQRNHLGHMPLLSMISLYNYVPSLSISGNTSSTPCSNTSNNAVTWGLM